MKQRIRFFIQLMIVVILGLSLAGGTIPAAFGQAGFAGGNGTPEDPYLVATPTQLNNVRNHLDKHFRQTAHINLGVAPWNEGEGWVPIGDFDDRFNGAYNGDGFAIYNLTIDRSGSNHQGLFGFVENASLANIRLENVIIIGQEAVGSLSGSVVNSKIENVFATGKVVGMYNPFIHQGGIFIGGLIGYLRGGIIHNTGTVADVIGLGGIGGLVGHAIYSDINTSFSTGMVWGSDGNAGGLIGSAGDGAHITNSYSHASVTGKDNLGGLVGFLSGLGQISHTFSTGRVIGTGVNVGGLIGSSENPDWVFDAYWDTQASGQATSEGGEGRTTAEMQQQQTYPFFNFYALWTIKEGLGYPEFQNLANYTKPQPVTLASLPGEGTETEPYVISNADQLNAIRQGLEAHYQLANDIDLSSTVIWDYGLGWQALGTDSAPFKGSLDGQGFAIHNLTINRSTDYQGLFGYVQDATLADMRLENISITSRSSYLGSLTGMAIISEIEKITAAGQVLGIGSPVNFVGGLVGDMVRGSISHSATMINVWGMAATGGVVGNNTWGEINTTFSTGKVQGQNFVGGLIGYANLESDYFINNYSRAAVTGENYVGGLVGQLKTSADGQISQSYSTGWVSGTGAHVGGLIGESNDPDTVIKAYWDQLTSGQTNSPGGGEGRTTDEMTYETAPNTYVGFDFPNTWAQDNTIAQRNDGYPYLSQVTQLKRTITGGANPPQGGTVSGGGTFHDGQTVTVRAAVEPGWVFDNWTEDGVVVSNNTSYTFTASMDRTLVANFVEEMPTTGTIPVASGTLYSPIDRTRYDFNPKSFNAEVNVTHIFKPFAPANAPADMTSLGYHFEVIAKYGDGTTAQLVGTVEIRIDFDAAGFSATQSVSLWRLGPTGWEPVPSTTFENQILFATLDQFSTFALFESGAPEPPQPDGYHIFLPLITQ